MIYPPRIPTQKQAFPDSKNEGMTLRDYFAARAMQGLMSVEDKGNFASVEEMIKKACELSFTVADAMLKQREL